MRKGFSILLLLVLITILPILVTNFCFSCAFFKVIVFGYALISIFVLSRILNFKKLLVFVDKKANYFFAGILIAVTLLFIASGLFQRGFVFLGDFSTHYSNALWIQKTFDGFQPFLGWTNDYNLGNFSNDVGRPFVEMIVDLLYYAGLTIIPFDLVFRFFIFIIFLAPIFAIYIFVRNYARGSLALVASIMWLSQTHFRFIIGNIDLYLGIPVFIGFLYFFLRYRKEKRTDYLFVAALLMSVTIYFHHILALFSIMFVALLILIDRKELYKTLYVFIPIAILTWSVFFYMQFDKNPASYLIAPAAKFVYGSFGYNLESFIQESLFSFPIFLLASWSILKTEKKYFAMIVPIVIIILISFYFLNDRIPIINAIHPEKVLLVERIFYIFVTVLFIDYILLKKIKINYSKYLLFIAIALIMTDFAIDFSAVFISWSNVHSPIFSQYYGRDFNTIFGTTNKTRIFDDPNNEDFQEILVWMKSVSTDSRIVFEHSFDKMQFNGQLQQMLPLWTGKKVVSAFRVYDGIFFDKQISNYSVSEFTRKLQLANVEYLAVWTPEFKQFLSQNDNFEKVFVTKNGLIEAYRLKNASHSYVDYNNSRLNATVVNMTDSSMDLEVMNAKKGDSLNLKVYYSFLYTSRWISDDQNKALISEGLPLDNVNHLLQVTLKQDGNYTVHIKYQNSLSEKILQVLPFATFVFIGILIVLINKKIISMYLK